MSANSESIAQRLRTELDRWIGYVENGAQAAGSAGQVEAKLWQGMLEMGRGLLQVYFSRAGEQEVIHDRIEGPEGSYEYRGPSHRGYVSLFGKVEVERAYYWNGDGGGLCPLDASLSLPERCYSTCVQERLSEVSVWVPEAQSVAVLERWQGLKIPKGSLQRSLSEQAAWVGAYYAQRTAPVVGEQDSILVATADGKGIPMTRADSPPPQARRTKGQKKTAKKEAIVTALYSVAPYVRSSQDIIQALLSPTPELPRASVPRPAPSGKQTFGTLAGKAAAFSQLTHQVAQRHADQFVHRVALSDGSLALQAHLLNDLPDFTLVLDIIHVTEYLWQVATALYGETAPERAAWMPQALHALLDDHLDDLLAQLDRPPDTLAPAQRDILSHVSAYLRRNRPFMDYQHYLAQGWPIGTGVVEGACRHLVKDRFEQAGMHWSMRGAQALLDLRAVAFNADWDDFQLFRRQQVHAARYHTPYPDDLPEFLALEVAA